MGWCHICQAQNRAAKQLARRHLVLDLEAADKNLNDGDDEIGDIAEFVLMEIEMGQLSGFCGPPNNLSPLTNGLEGQQVLDVRIHVCGFDMDV